MEELKYFFTIIFRPDMLKFHPYSILTGDTMVGFVIFCVLNDNSIAKISLNASDNFAFYLLEIASFDKWITQFHQPAWGRNEPSPSNHKKARNNKLSI